MLRVKWTCIHDSALSSIEVSNVMNDIEPKYKHKARIITQKSIHHQSN